MTLFYDKRVLFFVKPMLFSLLNICFHIIIDRIVFNLVHVILHDIVKLLQMMKEINV